MKGFFDIHCHILPGVDDGSGDLMTSMAMLKMEYGDGIRNIILTPHFRHSMFENRAGDLVRQFDILKNKAEEVFPDLSLYLGCEVHQSSDMADRLLDGKTLTMAGSDYVLVEFSGGDEKNLIRQRVREIQQCGFIPVLAHVERIETIRRELDFAVELKDVGVELQVNADTIIGKEGFFKKRFARQLMKEDLIDYVGSDAHGVKNRPPHMGECMRQIEKSMGKAYARHLLIENPSRILKNAAD